MKHMPEHRAPSPDDWDRTYKDTRSMWIDPTGSTLERVQQGMLLAGDVRGKHVLDMGGGPLLTRFLFDAGAEGVTVLDCSPVALEMAQQIQPRTNIILDDAYEFLMSNDSQQFDLCIAMGLLQFLPPTGLNMLFARAPATELVLCMPICEGYVTDYPSRVVVYSRNDVAESSRKHGWELATDLHQSEHIASKFRRVG